MIMLKLGVNIDHVATWSMLTPSLSIIRDLPARAWPVAWKAG